MNAGDCLQARARRVWRWFFPPEVALPEDVRRILRAVYPTLDLDAVSFHVGVPHLIRLVGSHAVTIPALLSPRRTRIYFDPAQWKPGSLDWLGTVVHEAFHALQVQDSRWGFGPIRPFLILYFACGAGNGFRYEGHPLETDAFQVAGRRWSRFESTFSPKAPDPGAVEENTPVLATLASSLRFWGRLAGSTPGLRRLVDSPARRLWLLALLAPLPAALWLLLWTAAASLVWLGRLLVEALGAAGACLLWGMGALLSLPGRILGEASRRGTGKKL
ncbi:MAG TPA: hypothetical protein VE685_04870 [Thermoanaerobaculia bacterium]|nr:hypothetical protein [Thermoanaerobaculia bacterium]